MPRSFPLYVVDDEPQVRQVLLDLAAQRGFAGRGFGDGEEFLDALPDLGPGCLLLDMRLPGRSGLEVQAELARLGVSFPIIAITGHADIDMAVEAMRMGALDFLEKPFISSSCSSRCAGASPCSTRRLGNRPLRGTSREPRGSRLERSLDDIILCLCRDLAA